VVAKPLGHVAWRHAERGSAAVLLMALAALTAALGLGGARLSAASLTMARAQTAADAAALAAADALARGRTPALTRRIASQTAAENGARLLDCDCQGTGATVTVAVALPRFLARAPAQARARAELRRKCTD
jgi:secretion/DNA translocation related TadE-like protein